MADTPPSVSKSYSDLLAWLQYAGAEGMAVLKAEPAWAGIQRCIDYVSGAQVPVRPTALSRIMDNRVRKVVLENVSALTDIRPIWAYHTHNKRWKEQGEILGTLVRAWWKNSHSAKKLQEALMYSAVGGTGYIKVQWNPYLPGGGDIELVALDPRDVVPIRPSFNPSVQSWEGVMIRQVMSVDAAKRRWPSKAHMIGPTTNSWFEPKRPPAQVGSMGPREIMSPAQQVLFGGKAPNMASPSTVDVIFTYVRDPSLNTSDQPVLMGNPNTNWCYWVYPVGSRNPITDQVVTEMEARLYPRGRLIVSTPDCILEDLPNPYWYEGFPIVKFCLDPMPWSILGSSMVADVISMQDGLNEGLRGVEDGMRQWIRRTVIADKNAISRAALNNFDPRKAGQKLATNPTAGEGIKVVDGPQFPTWMMQFLEYLKNEMDDVTGTRGLRELAQMKQMPSADTIEKFQDSMSPLLRLRSQNMEESLAEMAEIVKTMMFQYYDRPRRVQVLGPKGAVTEDFFDFDPDTMIPAVDPKSKDYAAQYDARLERIQRGLAHCKNFIFQVETNSLINVSHTQQKMFMLQLFRMGMLDPWSLWAAFDVPNTGPEPEGGIPDKIKAAQQGGLMPGPEGAPGGGPGRPPSGQQPPQMVNRTDPATGAPRPVVSESGR